MPTRTTPMGPEGRGALSQEVVPPGTGSWSLGPVLVGADLCRLQLLSDSVDSLHAARADSFPCRSPVSDGEAKAEAGEGSPKLARRRRMLTDRPDAGQCRATAGLSIASEARANWALPRCWFSSQTRRRTNVPLCADVEVPAGTWSCETRSAKALSRASNSSAEVQPKASLAAEAGRTGPRRCPP